MLLVNILIILFVYLLFYQLFYYISKGNNNLEALSNKSGEKYEEYDLKDPNNAMILSEKNAGNIDFIKGQLDDLMSLKKTVIDMSGNIAILNEQVTGLVSQQIDVQKNLVGDKPLDIDGLN